VTVFPVWRMLALVAPLQSRQNPHMPHTSPDKSINDLCLQIQGESDQSKLLQLIDQLDGVLDAKEKLMAKTKRPHTA